MRNRHFFFLDVVLLAGLPALAVSLRLESLSWPADLVRAVSVYTVLALGTRLIVAQSLGLYRCLWQHASISELQRILYAGAISGLITFLLGTTGLTATGIATSRLPYIALVLDALMATGVLAGPRLLARFAGRRADRSTSDRRAIVVGAGAAGQLILREARLNERLKVRVVAFVDDDAYKQQQLLGGIPVLGTLADLPSLISRLGVDEVIIAMPRARGSVVRRVVQAASDAGIHARTIPGFDDIISGRVNVSALRRVEIQDLLRRDAIVTDLAAVKELVV
jgi:FlaA1/EpsC-like NDP-sugar epimerase